MLDFDYTKEYSLPMEGSLRPMRIKKNPIQLDEGLICNDHLESKGIIQIMEYIGGGLSIPIDSTGMDLSANAVMVAEVSVSVNLEERKVHIKRIFYEYGHDELIPILMGQVLSFADFYNCRLCISDLNMARKLQAQAAISRENAFAGI